MRDKVHSPPYILTTFQIDWNDLAPKLGYASGAVASTRWGQIGKRLGFRNAGGKNQSNVSTPASTPVKLKVSGNMSSAALAGLDESPMKRKVNGGGKVKKESTRGRKKKGVRKAAASPEDTEDEDEDGDWQNNEGLKNEDEDVA